MTEAMFRRTFRELYPVMAYYAARFVGDDDADDIIQEAFLELWRHRDDLSDDEHLKAFLYRTVYTRSLDVIKHRHIVDDYSAAMKNIERVSRKSVGISV